jgi:hypothetical protein
LWFWLRISLSSLFSSLWTELIFPGSDSSNLSTFSSISAAAIYWEITLAFDEPQCARARLNVQYPIRRWSWSCTCAELKVVSCRCILEVALRYHGHHGVPLYCLGRSDCSCNRTFEHYLPHLQSSRGANARLSRCCSAFQRCGLNGGLRQPLQLHRVHDCCVLKTPHFCTT